ncbi:MAG: LON peptidase substrate-binding domain-containing protein, partial [Ureaplasma sp.]|nr:LON peptidase substrate-binding domain-containing protein [Ureaplasma sp.]
MKKILPIISTRGLVVLPETELTIEIGRPKSIEAILLAQEKKSDIIIATQINPNVDNPKINDIYTVGTLASIKKIIKDEKTGDYSIKFLGKSAVSLFFIDEENGEIPLTCEYEEIIQNKEFAPELIEDLQILIKEAIDKNIDHNKKYFEVASKVPMHETITYDDYIKTLNNLIMSYALFSPNYLIKALHANTIESRQTVLADIILKQIPNDENQRQVDDLINKKINESLSKQQKEFYLRE